MSQPFKRWLLAGLAVLLAAVALFAYSLPYLPVIHGTTDEEIERLATWLEIQPGAQVADFGAGDGTYALAMARRVGPSGHVFATEIDRELVAGIRQAAEEAGLSNLTVIHGTVTDTQLPEACCDAIFSRNVYHHLTHPDAINAGLFRALRPGGRMLVIDFEPGGIMDWLHRPETADRHGGHGTPKETVVKEMKNAGFKHARGPESWRGDTYAILFKRP